MNRRAQSDALCEKMREKRENKVKRNEKKLNDDLGVSTQVSKYE